MPVDWSALLAPENAAELRAFARTIVSQPELVRALERAFNARKPAGERHWQGAPADEDFGNTITASHAELQAFLCSMLPGQQLAVFCTFINHGAGQTGESGTRHPPGGPALYVAAGFPRGGRRCGDGDRCRAGAGALPAH